MEWPEPDPALHPYASEWFRVVGEVHPRPTPAAAQVARQWAAAFSARIAAGMGIPPAMVFEGEEAAGAADEMHRHPGTVGAHLIYWKVAAESGTSPPMSRVPQFQSCSFVDPLGAVADGLRRTQYDPPGAVEDDRPSAAGGCIRP